MKTNKLKALLTFAGVVCFAACCCFGTSTAFAWPDEPFCTHVWIPGAKGERQAVPLEDGVDLSGTNLTGARINRRLGKIRNANFANANLTGANLRETTFVNCSFAGANLTKVDAKDARFDSCDFTGATILGAEQLTLTGDQLKSTAGYRNKKLGRRGFSTSLWITDCEGLDFSSFNLSYCEIRFVTHGGRMLQEGPEKISYDDAYVQGGAIVPLNFQQLASTSDFRSKRIDVDCWRVDFSNVDLSGFRCEARFDECNFTNANFADAVVSDSFFCRSHEDGVLPTIEQLKSTWNWKNRRFDFRVSGSARNPVDFTNEDFSGFVFSGAWGIDANLTGADFTDAWFVVRDVECSGFGFCKGLTREQIMSTRNWKEREWRDLPFDVKFDWSNVDFSGFVVGFDFRNSNVTGANFTDAKIEYRGALEDCEGLTLEQVKSTWNYKTRNMDEIGLPKEIQAELDAEKAAR